MPLNHSSLVLRAYDGTHLLQDLCRCKSSLEYLFLDITGSLGSGQKCHEGRLQIRGKTGIRLCFNKKGKGTFSHAYPNLAVFFIGIHRRAGLLEFLQRHLKVRRANATQKGLSSSRHNGSPVGTGHYPVSLHPEAAVMKPGHSLYHQMVGSHAADNSPHIIKEAAHLADFRFPGSLVDDGHPVCQDRCQYGLFRGPHAWIGQMDFRALKSAVLPAAGLYGPIPFPDIGSQGPQRHQVQVNGPGSYETSARITAAALSHAAQQGA